MFQVRSGIKGIIDFRVLILDWEGGRLRPAVVRKTRVTKTGLTRGTLERRSPHSRYGRASPTLVLSSTYAFAMTIWDIYMFFFRRFRPRRMREFVAIFHVTPDTTILDVGGSTPTWDLLPDRYNVTLLNLDNGSPLGSMPHIIGDGRAIRLPDKSFEIVFSNSVIEHVGGLEDQKRFASEISRVGKRYYVQTPNRGFPIEPHFLVPFIHWLAKPLGRKLLALTPWALIKNPLSKSVMPCSTASAYFRTVIW
jgi:hypothetical protein